jgi:hypothetical protein
VAKALMDMYHAVYKNELDASRLKSKLDELEATMDIPSDGSADKGTTFASGGADLLSGGGSGTGTGYNTGSGTGADMLSGGGTGTGYNTTSGMGMTSGTGTDMLSGGTEYNS